LLELRNRKASKPSKAYEAYSDHTIRFSCPDFSSRDMRAKVKKVQTAQAYQHNNQHDQLCKLQNVFKSRRHNLVHADNRHIGDQWTSGEFRSIANLTAAVLTATACTIFSVAQTPVADAAQAPTAASRVQRSPSSNSSPSPFNEETLAQTGLTPIPPTSTQPLGRTAAPNQTVVPAPQAPNRTIIPAPATALPVENDYVLGPGDQIQLDIFDVPELSGAAAGRFVILVDGSINLPWVGKVPVQGLTLDQASSAVTKAYAPFIRDPLITVNLITARTLRISVAGEVKRPGAYVISPEGTTNTILVGDAAVGGGVPNQWPTVTQAIQSAGGVTQSADLRRVQVRRPLSDGSLEVIDLNLWELLRAGDLGQDVRLRDRDTLVIPTATALSDEEALRLGSANFSPSSIKVNVVGEVKNPATVEVPPNTPLNQALLAAGGVDRRRGRTGKVELIRLNPNGTASRRIINVDLAAGVNEETNPSLRDYDTIIVGRTGLTTARDFLDNLLAPLGAVFGIVNGF
jgi:polysaccharide export outer membrane protein